MSLRRVCTLSVLLVLGLPLFGSSILINNHSFENSQTFTHGDVHGPWNKDIPDGSWTVLQHLSPVDPVNSDDGHAGDYRPSALSGIQAFDGLNVAYTNGGILQQFLNVNVTNNTLYELTVAVGRREFSQFDQASYLIELLAGGIRIEDVFILQSITTIGVNQWEVVKLVANSFTFHSGELEIRLSSTAPQVLFDDVHLTATHLPEPATYAMIGFGMLGLWAFRRSRPSKK